MFSRQAAGRLFPKPHLREWHLTARDVATLREIELCLKSMKDIEKIAKVSSTSQKVYVCY